MRSFTLRILLCAALGLVTTIIVAWACAALVSLPMSQPDEERFIDADGAMVWRITQSAPGRTRINYVHGPAATMGTYHDEFPALVVPLLDAFSILRPEDAGSIEQSGWPLRALQCRSNELALASDSSSFTISRHAMRLEQGILIAPSSTAAPWRALPWQPIWPGLLIDAVIFGGFWWGLSYVSVLRARFRISRGRCPCCGYNLRGQLDAGCPECGWNRS